MSKKVFASVLDRDDTLKALLRNVQNHLEILSKDSPRTPLNAVVAAPGAGKTFLLGAFPSVVRNLMIFGI
jgi:hypothetical protein